MNGPAHSLKPYFLVYAALIVLTFLTVGAAFVNLGPFNVAAALVIAIVKGTLVVLIFMHVKDSSPLTWVFAAAGFYWLLILFFLSLSDYLSRPWS